MANRHPTGGFNVHPECINRKGRKKKGQTLTDILKVIMQEKDPNRQRPNQEVMLEKLTSMAKSGDVACIKYITDRIDGKPVERMITANDKTGKFFDLFEEESDEDK